MVGDYISIYVYDTIVYATYMLIQGLIHIEIASR